MRNKYTLAGYSRENNIEFRRLYEASGLARHTLADSLGVSFAAVKSWLKSEDAKGSSKCPDWAVEKLREILKPARRRK